GIVADHAADGGARGGRDVDRKPQPLRLEPPVELVENDPGLDYTAPAGHVELDQVVEIFRAVDDERGIDRLPRLRRARAAREHAHALLARNRQRVLGFLDRARRDNADRHDLVVRGVGRIAAARERGELDLAQEMRLEPPLEPRDDRLGHAFILPLVGGGPRVMTNRVAALRFRPQRAARGLTGCRIRPCWRQAAVRRWLRPKQPRLARNQPMTKNSARPVGRHFLHIPGPTPLPDRVLRAMDTPIIDHRGPEFAKLAKNCLDGIRTIFKTTNPVVIYTATGTGAWEAALVNTLSPGDRVLMVETGQFATLWKIMAEKLGLRPGFIKTDWRIGADPTAIEDHLRKDKNKEIKAVCVLHNETSTGCLSPIAEIRKAIDAANHPALFFVDTISSLASTDYRHDEWGVD